MWQEQQTPLHIAARLGNADNVLLLLQHGASPDATTKDLYTALHIASKEGHEDVVAVLLDHGANHLLVTKVQSLVSLALHCFRLRGWVDNAHIPPLHFVLHFPLQHFSLCIFDLAFPNPTFSPSSFVTLGPTFSVPVPSAIPF